MNTTNRIEEIKKRVREEIEAIEEALPMATYNWSPDDWLNKIDKILEEELLTYGDQRAEEGAQQARKHYYDKVDREAREKEAYLWFNTWYERNIDPGNKQMFGKWASERLQELGCTPPNTTE